MPNEILIVDDCAFTAKLLATLMRDIGFSVRTACSAEEAVTFLETQQLPGIFFVDWVMPGMSGVEFVAYLRSRPATKEIPIVMVTGERDLERVAEALRQGANEYIMKPFTKESILDKLRLIGIDSDVGHE